MPIERSERRISPSRIASIARRLLKASTLCAIATVSPDGRAHLNTAYFAWDRDLGIVWLSAPEARHSRNLRANPSAAIAVYDSTQSWGGSDRGIQLFGAARELTGKAAREADALYAARFRAHARGEWHPYRFYRFRPRRMKLFHERELGGGTFVTARVHADGRVQWIGTESYRDD